MNEHREHILELLLGDEAGADKFDVYARAIVLIGLTVWALTFISKPIASETIYDSWLHYLHLVFHEAGHILFWPFGDWLTSAGGTIMQLLTPLICLWTFLFKERNRFGAAVCAWWLGHSLMNCAPYAADARSQTLILLGGVTGRDVPGYHDWNTILSPMGLLDHAGAIGALLHLAGVIMIVLSLVWGAYLLFRQHRLAATRPF